MAPELLSRRMEKLQQVMTPFLDFFNDPVFNNRINDPLACDFALGNPHDMPLPAFVEALQRWSVPQNKDWFAYKLNEPRSCEVIAGSLKQWRGIDFRPEDIMVTNGAFAAIAVALGAILDPGDEVIFISPPWFFYESMIASAGGVPVRVKINFNTFNLDLGAIEAAITPKTRAVIVNTPHNPTGKIYSTQTLKDLADLLTRARQKTQRPIFWLSDESYSRIVYDDKTFTGPTSFYPHTLLLYTYGKTLLTPGQRMGYIALSPDLPEPETVRTSILISQFTTGYAFPNALLQHAIGDLEKLSIDIPTLQKKRDRLVKALGDIGYELKSPEGTFYLLPRSPIPDDKVFTKILSEQHIYCLPGSVAEAPGYFRISITANDAMIDRSLPGFALAMELARQRNSVYA